MQPDSTGPLESMSVSNCVVQQRVSWMEEDGVVESLTLGDGEEQTALETDRG